MPKIDAIASLPHYLDHLAPIWRALPDELRGDLTVPVGLFGRAEARGCTNLSEAVGDGEYVLAASYWDYADLGGTRKVILSEHGAGQSYGGDPNLEVNRHPAYAGGRNRDEVVLFLNPGEHPAKRNADAYPDAVSVACGSPRLDELIARKPVGHEPTVVFTWHYNAQVCPESMSGFAYWREPTIAALEHAGYRVLAHAHPRAATDVLGFYDLRRTLYVPEFEEIVDQGDILIGDNTSAMFEWSALGRPVIALDSPEWRPAVRHGLRFWDHVPGTRVRTMSEFEDAMASILPEDALNIQPLDAGVAAFSNIGRSLRAVLAAIETVVEQTAGQPA